MYTFYILLISFILAWLLQVIDIRLIFNQNNAPVTWIGAFKLLILITRQYLRSCKNFLIKKRGKEFIDTNKLYWCYFDVLVEMLAEQAREDIKND